MGSKFDEFGDDYRRPRSGRMQTKDDAMGIFGGMRVSNTNRDDVVNHIAACVTHGYLTDQEAAARMDAAAEARTEGDLIHIARDLPSEERLLALKTRKRLSKRVGTRFGRVSNWLFTRKTGRALFHASVAALALMTAIIPGTVIDSLNHGRFGALGAAVTVATIVVGVIAFVVNLAFTLDWFS